MTVSPTPPPAADAGLAAYALPSPAERPLAEVVIFDGNCHLCTAQVSRLAKWDTRRRLAFLSLHDPEVGRRYPHLTHEVLMRDMVVVDRRGRFHHGAAALRELAGAFHGFGRLSPGFICRGRCRCGNGFIGKWPTVVIASTAIPVTAGRATCTAVDLASRGAVFASAGKSGYHWESQRQRRWLLGTDVEFHARFGIHLMVANPQQTHPQSDSSPAAASAATVDGHASSVAQRGTALGSPRRRRTIRIAAVLVAMVLLVVGLRWLVRALNTVSTDDAYVNGHVTFVAPRVPGQVTKVLVDDNNRVSQGDLLVVLDKEPYEVQVELKQASVDTAKANVLVAQDQVRGIVAQARSNRYRLEHAMEDVRDQLASLKAKVAQLDVEKANLVFARSDYARLDALVGKGAVSTQDFDKAKASLDVAKNRVTAAEQDIQEVRAGLGLSINVENPLDVPPDLDQNFSTVRQALADLLASAAPLGVHPSSYTLMPKQIIEEFYKLDPEGNLDRIYERLVKDAPAIKEAEARLEVAQADLDQAKLNLRYCDVFAEISGVITRRNVNPGNNVQAGQGLMAIRSLTEIWVDANFKETQLANLRIGQHVELNIDMYGRRRVFDGRISGFTMGTGSTLALLPAQNATGNFIKIVQRLPVRIEFTNYDPDKEPVFVGLSVVPYVLLKEPPTGPNAGKVLQPDFFPKSADEKPANSSTERAASVEKPADSTEKPPGSAETHP